MIYIIPFIITLICSIKYDFGIKKTHIYNICGLIVFISLVLIIGLRYEVGGDTYNYMNMWPYVDDLKSWKFDILSKYQPLYTLICAISKSISEEFYIFQIIHSLLLNVLIYIFIFNYTNNKFTALLISFFTFYLYFSTEILRESLAVMVFSLNIKNYIENKYIKYYIGIFIACLFHISACFLIILPFIKWMRFDKKIIIIIIILPFIIINLQNLFSIFENITIIEGKIEAYRYKLFGGYLINFFNTIRYIIIPICLIAIARKFEMQSIKYESLLCFLIIISICSFFNYTIFSRLTNYFLPILTIIIADTLVSTIKFRRKRNIFLFFILLIILGFGSDFIHRNKYTLWIPYYSIFNPKQVEREFYNLGK